MYELRTRKAGEHLRAYPWLTPTIVGAGSIRRQQREERLVMGLDIRHQVLRVALSVKVNGKRRRLSLHRARPPRTCVKLSMKITVTTSRVGAYPHTQKSGLRRLTGAYPHTKISVAQSYPDPYVFGIQGPCLVNVLFRC